MASPTFNGTAVTAGNSSGTSLTINKPGSTAVGERLGFIMTLEDIDDVVTAPSGWSLVFELTQSGAATPYRFFFYTRLVDGSEGANFTWTWTDSAHRSGGMWRMGGATSGAAYLEPDFDNDTAGSASNTASSNGIAPVTPETLLLLLQADTNASGSVTGGPTERIDFNRVYLATEALAAAGATGSRSVSLTASQWWINCLYAVRSVLPASPIFTQRPWRYLTRRVYI